MNIPAIDIPKEIQEVKTRFGIVGSAPALIGAIQRAVTVAPIDLSVLITGESGTGKEFFPKIIHQFSPRKHSKYIAVNCGAIPEGTIDSELFGHEKGAFTGAIATRKGYFEEADGGTVFLDEVAELPLTTQARLLRVLETGEFMKVGSSTVQRTNIRIVAATNVDMQRAVAQGKFREDLYYRLSTVQIHIPPLRERGNDIMLLANKFAADFSERYRTPRIDFDNTARDMLLYYRWPGNVRQLKNVIEQIALFDAGKTVGQETVAPYLPESHTSFAPVHSSSTTGIYEREREMLLNMIMQLRQEVDTLRTRIDCCQTAPAPTTTSLVRLADVPSAAIAVTSPIGETAQPIPSKNATLVDSEKEAIRNALLNNMGRRRDAAAELNISERTLYRKIKEYNLE